MVESVKNKRIQETYQKYLQNKQGVSESQKTFKSKLEERRKLSNMNETNKGNLSPKIGKAKKIHLKQAVKIAKYGPIIMEMSAKYKVPVELICGVILQESGGNAKAKSHAGAKGLMQLMPATAKRFGVKNIYNPRQNIEGGTKYLRFLMDRFGGNIELTLAGYNAGEGNVEKYGNKIPPFEETQNYVPAVKGYTQTMINILSAAAEVEPSPSGRRV